MTRDRSRIEELAKAVAEGARVDWDAVLSETVDSDERRAIEQLRAVDDIAHRGAFDDEAGTAVTRTLDHVATTLSSGQVLGGRYRIQAFLGRGGMGHVWHAFDLKLRVDVALKMVLPEYFAEEPMLERLRREVRSAREVISPNVCRIFDLVEIEGRELVSMEYIDGTTLLETLRERGPLELRETGEIAAQFLAGLDAIHRAGLIHRDVKPDNIMITRSGRVVLMDFGLAKPETGRPGTISGTPAYMAPEQMRGEALNARADIFAAGVVLAEMIGSTGDKASREPIHRGAHEDPPNLPESPWRSVLVRAVAKDPGERFSSAQALIRALEEVTLRVEGAEQMRPYPGLASFTENDVEYFFGREAEIEAVWKKLRRPHLLAVIGPSGAGKSSFLRAGLIPAMPQDWRHVLCHPGDAPLLALGRTLAPELAGDTEAIREMIRFEDPAVAVDMFRRWRDRHGEALLIVDQFEELFTLNQPEIQASFAELLGRLALEADVHVLLSMRDDFLFRCHEQPALTPMLSELSLLGPPVGAALRRAVVQPALKCGYRFEDDQLVDEILAEVEGERGALPLLAFAVARLWDKRDREAGMLTRRAYEEIGGVGGALAQHAEATVEKVGAERLPLVRELFRNLVTAQGTRAARDVEELLSVFPAERKAAEEVLHALIDARLLTSFEYAMLDKDAETKRRRVEIIHESLITAWPRLVRWRTLDADSAQMRDQLRQVASMWEERGRPEDLLWTGTSFKEYEVWRERYPGSLTETEEAFARSMRDKALRKRRRRRIAVGAAFVALLAVLGVVGGLWKQSQRAERRARSEALRSEASALLALGRNLRDEHPTAAMAYTMASLERADTPEARRFAMEILWRGPLAFSSELENFGLALDFSPDGTWLAGVGGGVGHVLWKSDGSPPRILSDRRENDFVRFVAEGGLYVSTDVNGWTESPIHVWSVPDMRSVATIQPQADDWGWINRRGLLVGRKAGGCRRLFLRYPWTGGEPEKLGVFEFPPGWCERLLDSKPAYWESALANRDTVDVDPDDRWLVYADGSDLFVVPLDDLESAVPKRVGGPDRRIIWVEFLPDGDRVVTREGEWDKYHTKHLWSVSAKTEQPTATVPWWESGTIMWKVTRWKIGATRYAFDATGHWLAATEENERVTRVWDLQAPPHSAPFVLRRGTRQARFTRGLALHPSGKWVATVDGATVSLWPLGRRYPWVLEDIRPGVFRGLAFDPHGEWVATTKYRHGPTRLWALSPKRGEEGRLLLPTAEAAGLVVAPDGETVAGTLWTGEVLLMSVEGGEPRMLQGFTWATGGGGMRKAFSPDGRLLAAAGTPIPAPTSPPFDPDDQIIRIWEIESGEARVIDPGHRKGFWSLEFTPDGRLLTSGPAGLQLWNLESETSQTLLEDVEAGSLGPDGRHWLGYRAHGCDTGKTVACFAYIVDLETGARRRLSSHGENVTRAVWHPSGEQVVTGSADGAIRVGPMSGEEPHLLLGHEAPISHLAVHPDGAWIASTADGESSLRLWPMPEGRPLHRLPHDEFLARLRSLTNYRVVPDETSPTGYRIEIEPFPGWENVPTW